MKEKLPQIIQEEFIYPHQRPSEDPDLQSSLKHQQDQIHPDLKTNLSFFLFLAFLDQITIAKTHKSEFKNSEEP